MSIMPVSAALKPMLKINVMGISGDMLGNVRTRLAIESREFESTPTAQNVTEFSRKSRDSVRDALKPYGYFQPTVRVEVHREKNNWVLVYHIVQGLPVKVTSVDVSVTGAGRDNKKILRSISRFPLKRGDVFNSVTYTSARERLFDVINNEGYIKAVTSESKVLVNTKTHTAVIRLSVDTRQRYYFGKITFSENAYDPAFMQRFDTFKKDEPFSSNKLLQYQQDMNGSRYFKQVLVIPDLKSDSNIYVPIQASIVPVNYRRYDFGLGYGTFTGPRLTAGFHFPRLTNTGHSLDALIKLSSVLSGAAVKYNIPGANPLTEQWNIGGNMQKFIPKNGKSYSKTVTVGYTRKLHHWQFSANMNYLWERYTVTDTPTPSRNSQLLYPNLNINYMKTDNVVQPTYGRSLNLSLQGASDTLLSSTSFLQGEVKGKLFLTPVSFAHIIVRADVGYTVVNDLNDLPLSMRFFAGGVNSIRGFIDQGIGPGKYLGVASIEYRNHIAYDISGAIFYDIGTATNHIGSPLNRGVGVGLVYESVVGPIKLYLAQAISKPSRPHSIEFSMGPEF